MATIPVYNERSIALPGAPNQYQRIQADPDAFGASIGRATQQAGATLGNMGTQVSQIAIQRQEEANQQARANTLLSGRVGNDDEVNTRLYGDGQNPGWLQKQGAEAVGIVKQGEALFEQQRARVARITDPVIRQNLMQDLERSRAATLNQLRVHEQTQHKAVTTGLATAQAGVAGKAIAGSGLDPAILAEQREKIFTGFRAANAGMPDDVWMPKAKEAVSAAIHDAIGLQTNPVQAMALAQKHFDAGDLEAAHFRKLQTDLQPKVLKFERNAVVSGAMQAGMPGGTVAEALQAAGPVVNIFANRETGGESDRAGAVSSAGAMGVMQIMPDTAKGISRAMGDGTITDGMTPQQIQEFYRANPAVNIAHGTFELNRLAKKYRGEADLVIIGYNAGEGKIKAYLDSGRDPSVLPAETQKYMRDVLPRLQEVLGGGDNKTAYGRPTFANMPPLPAPGAERFTRENWPLKYWKPNDILDAHAEGQFVDARSAIMIDELGSRFEQETGLRVRINDGDQDKKREGNRRGTTAREGSPHVHGSKHHDGMAFDIQIKHLPPEARRRFVEMAREAGFTGIGFYGDDGHVHLDTGAPRRWGATPTWLAGVDLSVPGGPRLGQTQFSQGYKSPTTGTMLPTPFNMAQGERPPLAPMVAQFQIGQFDGILFGAGGAQPATPPAAPALPEQPATLNPHKIDWDRARRTVEASTSDPAELTERLRALEQKKNVYDGQVAERVKQLRGEYSLAIDSGAMDANEIPDDHRAFLATHDPEALIRFRKLEESRKGTSGTEREDDLALIGYLRNLSPPDMARVDLSTVMDRLAPKTYASLAKEQQDIRAAIEKGDAKVSTMELRNQTAKLVMNAAPFGQIPTGSGSSTERANAMRQGLFLDQYHRQVAALEAAKKGPLTQEEMRAVANELLTPVSRGSNPTYLFEVGSRTENMTRQENNLPLVGDAQLAPAASYQDIPVNNIAPVVTVLRARGLPAGTEPTRMTYNAIVNAVTGRPVSPDPRTAGPLGRIFVDRLRESVTDPRTGQQRPLPGGKAWNDPQVQARMFSDWLTQQPEVRQMFRTATGDQ